MEPEVETVELKDGEKITIIRRRVEAPDDLFSVVIYNININNKPTEETEGFNMNWRFVVKAKEKDDADRS